VVANDPDATRTQSATEMKARDLQPRALFTVVFHPEAERIGNRFPLDVGEDLPLGRSSQAFGEGALDRSTVSRQHAEVTWSDFEPCIRDLGSRNGTRVDGDGIQTARLRDGSVVELGGIALLVRLGLAAAGPTSLTRVVGVSDGIREVLAQVELAAARETTVLLLGETGTGKEVLAREVHRWSQRPGRFVAVNCGALGEGVLQSELFGHTRGAFSGASRARAGLVEEAEGGTLFLDEVGEAPPALQVALLRLLQEREVRPVGSNKARKVDVRFVAATNRELEDGAAAGAFRADLLARLRRWVVRIPPLRERREDIPVLARQFLARQTGRPVRLARRLTLRMLDHDWPGNVRELEAFVERLAVAQADRDELVLEPWGERLLTPAERRAPPPDPVASPAPRQRPVRPARPELEAMLARVGGNVRALSETLGVSRNTLYRWFKEEGIAPAAWRSSRDGT